MRVKTRKRDVDKSVKHGERKTTIQDNASRTGERRTTCSNQPDTLTDSIKSHDEANGTRMDDNRVQEKKIAKIRSMIAKSEVQVQSEWIQP